MSVYRHQVSGYIHDDISGIHTYLCNDLRDFEYNLPDEPLLVAFDQSTSCTGIAVRNNNKSFVMILDFLKENSLSRDIYMQQLTGLVNTLFKDKKITIAIHEKLPPAKYARSGRVLSELIGVMKSWCMFIPEFVGLEFKSILPHQWKSVIVDKSKGKGRFYNKSEIAMDIVDRYPYLEEYYILTRRLFNKSYDFDAFEALGMLDGYLTYYNLDEQNMKDHLVRCDDKFCSKYNVVYRKIQKSLLDEDPFDVFFRPILLKMLDLDKSNPRVEIFNPDLTLFENYRIASTYKGLTVFLTDDSLLTANMNMEYGKMVSSDEIVCCYYVPDTGDCSRYKNIALNFPDTVVRNYNIPYSESSYKLTADDKVLLKNARLMNS